MFLSGTDRGDLAAAPHGARRSRSRSPTGFPRSRSRLPRTEGAGPVPGSPRGGLGRPGPQPPPRSPTWRLRRRQPRGRGHSPAASRPIPVPRRCPGAHGGQRAEPRGPSISLPLALPAGRPTEAGRAGGSRSPSRFLLHPRRGRNCRAAAAPRRGQVRALTASEEPSGAAAAAEFRALSRERERAREREGVRAEGREEQCVPGTARPSPPRAPLRPWAQLRPRSPAPAAAAPPAAAPPRRCRERRWLPLPGLPAAPSPPCCSPSTLPWPRPPCRNAPALSGSPALGPARDTAPHLGSVPC